MNDNPAIENGHTATKDIDAVIGDDDFIFVHSQVVIKEESSRDVAVLDINYANEANHTDDLPALVYVYPG